MKMCGWALNIGIAWDIDGDLYGLGKGTVNVRTIHKWVSSQDNMGI
jgi:hypothetical protein